MALTGNDEQKRRALAGGFNPTLPTLYDDAEIRRANPYYGVMAQALAHAVARPAAVTGTRYNRVSSAFSSAVHAVLAGQADAATALRSLDGQLMRISRGGRW
jgi:trehalose/maltose transport system substrate-binding protein